MITDLFQSAQKVSLPTGAKVFRPGGQCDTFYYIITGTIRVDLLTEDGRSVLLYEINADETCVLTTACILSGDAYAAEATAQTPVTAYAMAKSDFDTQLQLSSAFRNLVFTSFGTRVALMMGKVDEIAFQTIDARLARRILKLGEETAVISTTHDQLGHDLGTAREVVSRKLKIWEKKGLIQRDRGTLTLLDRAKLSALAAMGD
jgi:CRP/FNR family transcriptional regulator